MEKNSMDIGRQSSQTNNQHASYANEGPVYNAPVTKQVVNHDASKTYMVDKEDDAFDRLLAEILIGKVGEKPTLAIGGASGVVALSVILGLVYRPSLFGTWIGYLLVGSVVVASVFIGAYKFSQDRRCPSCQTPNALLEVGPAPAKEVPTAEGVRKTTIRRYQCRECSHETERPSNDLVSEQNRDSRV